MRIARTTDANRITLANVLAMLDEAGLVYHVLLPADTSPDPTSETFITLLNTRWRVRIVAGGMAATLDRKQTEQDVITGIERYTIAELRNDLLNIRTAR